RHTVWAAPLVWRWDGISPSKCWGSISLARHLIQWLGKAPMKPRNTLSAHPRLGVKLFRRRGVRAMMTLLPQLPSLTHISHLRKSSFKFLRQPPSALRLGFGEPA